MTNEPSFEKSVCQVEGCEQLTKQYGVCVRCQQEMLEGGVTRQ